MLTPTSISIKHTLIISISLLFLSCTSFVDQKADYFSPLQLNQEDNTLKSVVIMPFDNETHEKDIEILTRESFYNHFSSKNYRDFELAAVDSGLEILMNSSSSTYRDLPPSNIGEIFHADFLIYGKVKEFKKIFLGIYSQILLRVELEIIDHKSGQCIWRRTVTKRSHDGGIPFNLLGIIPAALRSSFHMKHERTIELVDRVSRELAEQIPEPPSPPVVRQYVEIQVASFLENTRAEKILKSFEGKGLSPRIEIVTIGDKVWHRLILGPYFNLHEAERIKSRILQNTQFQPIFIHHYPEISEKGDQPN